MNKWVKGFAVWLVLSLGAMFLAVGTSEWLGYGEYDTHINAWYQVFSGILAQSLILLAKKGSEERTVVAWAARVQMAIGLVGLLLKWLT